MEKLNTLTVDEMKSKLRARSVSKANNDHNESGEMERQSLSQIKKNRYGKHSSSSLLKEKIGSNNNYFLNSVKLNANMSNKNIIKLEYDTKESIVKNQLISDKPITMKVTEAKIIETWRDFDEASEPMTPVKFVDTINKEFKTNNSNIVNFVSKKNRKSPKKKKNKLKNISVPSYIEKIEEANETSKKKPIKEKITKKIQLKENYKIQPLQDKSKISNEVKPPNTIRYKSSKIQSQVQPTVKIRAQPLTQRDMQHQIENSKIFSNTIIKSKSPPKPQIGWSKGFSLQVGTNFINNRRGSQLLPKIGH